MIEWSGQGHGISLWMLFSQVNNNPNYRLPRIDMNSPIAFHAIALETN